METSTSSRLKEALSIRNMRPVELSEKAKMPRSAISQYLSGKVNPKQDKIFIMAGVLDVSPSWLMGLDVPMQRTLQRNYSKIPPTPVPEEEKENLLMTLYADNPMIIKWLKENNFVLRGNMAAIKDDGKLLLKHAILSSIENEEKEKEK